MARSLLMSLLNVSEEDYTHLPEETRKILLSVLYDAWSRDGSVELAWLEALQSSDPGGSLTAIRDRLKAPVLAAAQALKVKIK